MDGYSISQASERTGFPPTTLRFYEQAGLVRPQRTSSGYRCYDEDQLELLAFIRRAKGFGLRLDEITELLPLVAADECAPVQGRLRALVDEKLENLTARIDELTAFRAELRQVAATMEAHTATGPCDDECGCTTGLQVSTSALRR